MTAETPDYSGTYKRNITGRNAGTAVTITRRTDGGYAVVFASGQEATQPLTYDPRFVARLIRNKTWTPLLHPALRVSEGL